MADQHGSKKQRRAAEANRQNPDKAARTCYHCGTVCDSPDKATECEKRHESN